MPDSGFHSLLAGRVRVGKKISNKKITNTKQITNLKFQIQNIVRMRIIAIITFCFVFMTGYSQKVSIPDNISRTWLGPDWWANPLQDWEVDDGKINCIASKPDRNAFLLTYSIADTSGSYVISARMGFNADLLYSNENMIGFRIGINGEFNDYRDDAIYGKGIDVGITSEGNIKLGEDEYFCEFDNLDFLTKGFELKLIYDAQNHKLHIYVIPDEGIAYHTLIKDFQSVSGGIALISDINLTDNKKLSPAWFNNISMNGDGIHYQSDRAWGPVLFAMYTLSNNILKINAQLAPVTKVEGDKIILEINRNGSWEVIAEAKMDELSRTALFCVENWTYNIDIPYRISCWYFSGNDKQEMEYYEGMIRKDPVDKEEIVLAAFTGNNDLGFPNNDLVKSVEYMNPDLLFFSGDQIYEGVGGYKYIRLREGDISIPTLDYLRKWYLVGWAYGNLMKSRPTIAIPDDHDVYQSNIWGAGGINAPTEWDYVTNQTSGGYMMPPEWVNMVQRTQVANLPDPFDPDTVAQGIEVYYTALNYGCVSFAILEDRKFKSGPQQLFPDGKIWNGWAQNAEFNVKEDSDIDGAELMGQRQLGFLEDWGEDWSNGIEMKAVLSQTIFANVATIPDSAMNDNVVPGMHILPPGAYPEGDKLAEDMDSNGWPKTGRDEAVKAMRKSFAVHIAGDQHLGSATQYGVDEWKDASYAFCVPSISNVWPRRWFPSEPGLGHINNMPGYTGDYEDGFGNKITICAVSNPHFSGKKPSKLYDRATGYGLIRFNKDTREITFECWPRWVDPADSNAQQYEGWPIEFHQYDNYISKAPYHLPVLKIAGPEDPVIKVYNLKSGELVYSIRIKGNMFQPKVFEKGRYGIVIGYPDNDEWIELDGVNTVEGKWPEIRSVRF